MPRYEVEGRIYDTGKALQHWEEELSSDGSNMISCATGSQWIHETLFQSPRDQFWVEIRSQWEGAKDHARLLSREEAVLWLDRNGWEIPSDMAYLAETLEG